MKRLYLITAMFILSAFTAVACAQTGIPQAVGHVNDFAGMIPDDVEKSLESRLMRYKQESTNEIAVVTVKSIGDQSVEDYTIRLAEKWKVGKKDKDNGVIILIAKEERKIRIEVGYGLEGVLPDIKAKMIIEREMTPRFKAGDYSGGIQAGVNAVIATLEGSYAPTSSGSQPVNSGGWPVWLIIILIVGGIFVVALIISFAGGGSGGSGGYWSSGDSSGGGGGFGGGSFGGGGASGGW